MCLRELSTYLFSLYWVWYSLSFTALYSFWYLSSCSLILETSVENASGKLSACCRWNFCCRICSVKFLAFSSSWTSDSWVLGSRKTDLHNEKCTPSIPSVAPVGGMEHVHSCSHSWVQFTLVLFWGQTLHSMLRWIRLSSWLQVAHHAAEGIANWNACWQVLPLVSRSRQWEVDRERTKFNGIMCISFDFEEWPRLPRKGENEGSPLNFPNNLAFLSSPDTIIDRSLPS